MRLLIILVFLMLASSSLASLSTVFPYFFPARSTPRPVSPGTTNTVRRAFTRRTDFFGVKGRGNQRTKLSLQVSLGPMIFPDSLEQTTPLSSPKHSKAAKFKSKRRTPLRTSTTTEQTSSYEEYHESEEVSTDFTTPAPTTAKSEPLGFMQRLKDSFPSIHDWLYENEATTPPAKDEKPSRQPRMPKTFFTSKREKQKHLKTKAKGPYGRKPVATPPKKLTPPRPPPFPKKPKPVITPPPFEQEEDIQAAGFTQPPPVNTRPKPHKGKPKPTFEQFPAQENPSVFESEQNVLPSGQFPVKPTKGYGYAKPKPEISRELFFYEPPQQFAPSQAKPYRPKPPLPPKKEYKVIFIKAPEPEPPIIPDIPQLQPAPEQKTLIYVVAKKPEEPPNITLALPVNPPTQKPDVFFVRYKVTTTTPQPDESEQEVLPGGFEPTPKPTKPGGYKYTKPTKKPKTTTTPEPDESEEQVLPGGQFPTEPTDEYLPPNEDEQEEQVLPGGQFPTEPTDEYLPPPDENEEEVLPGGQEPTTSEPPTDYLPPVDEHEEEILPAGYYPTEPPKESENGVSPGNQLEPPKPPTGYNYDPPPKYYLPKPYWPNQYLPAPPPSYGPAAAPPWQNQYLPPPAPSYGPAIAPPWQNQYLPPAAPSYGPATAPPSQNTQHGGYSSAIPQSHYFSPNGNYKGNSYTPAQSHYYSPPKHSNPNYGLPVNPNYGLHNPKGYEGYSNQPKYGPPSTVNTGYNSYQPQYNPKNLHTVHPPRHFSLPLRYSENTLHRQGTLTDDTSLDSLLFQSLGLTPFPQ